MTFWVAGAAIGGAVIGGVVSSNNASKAANAQKNAANLSDSTQRYFYDTNRADNAPFMANGTAASNQLAYLMGLSPNGGTYTAGGGSLDANQLRTQLLPQYTKTTAGTAQPGSQVMHFGEDGGLSDFIGSGVNGPQSTSIDEEGLNAEIQRQLAAQTQRANDPSYGSLARNFSASDFQQDPGYQFRMQQGQQALERSAAARGGLLSGRAMKDTLSFAQGLGAQEYGDAFNRYNTNQTTQYNRLAGIAGSGQTANAQVGNAGTNAGNQISASQQGAGNAAAAGYIGQANAINGAIGSGWNMYQQNQLLNKLTPYSRSDFGANNGFYYGNGSSGD